MVAAAAVTARELAPYERNPAALDGEIERTLDVEELPRPRADDASDRAFINPIRVGVSVGVVDEHPSAAGERKIRPALGKASFHSTAGECANTAIGEGRRPHRVTLLRVAEASPDVPEHTPVGKRKLVAHERRLLGIAGAGNPVDGRGAAGGRTFDVEPVSAPAAARDPRDVAAVLRERIDLGGRCHECPDRGWVPGSLRLADMCEREPGERRHHDRPAHPLHH